MFRSITCDFVSGGTGIGKETYCCANVAATFDALNADLVTMTTMITMAAILVAPSARYHAVHVIVSVGVVRGHRHHGAASHTVNLGHGSAASPNWWGKWTSLWKTWRRSAWQNSRDCSIRPIELNLENILLGEVSIHRHRRLGQHSHRRRREQERSMHS